MGIFNYDSKLMQSLSFLADLIILNLCFIVCSLPIFTIGAAQAGLYTAIKVLLDKDDDSSSFKAFFRGFANGFGRITIPWLCFLVMIVLVGFNLLNVLAYQYSGLNAPVVISIIGLCICALFQTMMPPFHARFSCTSWQLVKNNWFMVLAHPLRSILVTGLTWVPVIVLAVDPYTFMSITPLWGAFYYSTIFMLCFRIMKKPYEQLTQQFLDSTKAAEENPDAEALPEQAQEALAEETTSL